MIQDITKHHKTSGDKYKFSILVPSWNNIDFLKVCVNSIQKNSHFDIQIIVIVNEGNDDTIKWLEEKGEIDYIHSKTNIGICYGLNIARSLIKSDYVVYVNDDMYLLPNWDLEFHKEIEAIGHKNFMLSASMVEPMDTNNPCVVVKDYGTDIESFKEEQLLKEYTSLFIKDWNGSMWPPNVVHIDIWDIVGGYSIEYSPGMYSDPDFCRKLMAVGVTLFKGKGTSLAYHFGSKSTKRVKKNDGRKTFLLKWGITPKTFTKEFLRLGAPFMEKTTFPTLSGKTKLENKIKRFLN